MKRYIIRSVKYFLYLIIIMTLLLAILVLLGLAEADPAEIFVGGYSSYWKIGLAFLALAAIYPRFGYSKNEIISGVELKPLILSVMDSRGYKLRRRHYGIYQAQSFRQGPADVGRCHKFHKNRGRLRH